MSPAAPSPSPQRPLWLLIVLLATIVGAALKAAWALNSIGTSDIAIFFAFGEALHKSSLAEMYTNYPMFNHTPLTGWLMEALFRISGGGSLQAEASPEARLAVLLAFASGLRLLCVGADLGVVAGLLYLKKVTGRPPWWALALFAASPVSIMVSGFHGNVDPIMVLFLVAAAVALTQRWPGACGAFFALACNVKVMPLLLAPLFLGFYWQQGRRALLRFGAAAGGLILLGSAVPLLQCPAPYASHVLGYGSYWGTWGITYALHQAGIADFQTIGFRGLSAAQNWVALDLKLVMSGAVLALAWRRRAVPGADFLTTLAAAFTVIFVFAPGLGPQYLVWLAPFLLWSAPEWYAVVTACSAAFMYAFYAPASKGGFPWDSAYPKGPEIGIWGPWMYYPWLALVLFLLRNARGWWQWESREIGTADRSEELPSQANAMGIDAHA